MTKQQFLAAVEAKQGFHSIIKDELASDHVPSDPIEKRFLYVNHTNADGTMGKKFVYYLYDTVNDIASFYNVEEELDLKKLPTKVEQLKALEAYLAGKYQAYFVIRYDLDQKVAEADVFELENSTLTKKRVLVFKKGTNPINDLIIV